MFVITVMEDTNSIRTMYYTRYIVLGYQYGYWISLEKDFGWTKLAQTSAIGNDMEVIRRGTFIYCKIQIWLQKSV